MKLIKTWKKIKRNLRHLFIPHRHNSYKPHIFRELSVGIIIALVFFLFGLSYSSNAFIHGTVLGANIATDVLVDLANDSRAQNNIVPLVRNIKLDGAADLKASDMIAKGYFAHNSPEGLTPWYFIQKAGYNFNLAGENLAINYTDSKSVQGAWLDSPGHRANLMNSRFEEVGMAVQAGKYEGEDSIYVVQMFGTPSSAKKVESQPNTIAINTEVKKESAIKKELPKQKVLLSVENKKPLPKVEMIVLENKISDKNIETKVVGQVLPAIKYSTWYERALYHTKENVNLIYISMLVFLLICFCIMIFVEYRRQHFKHIFYGLAMMAVILLLLYFNL